MKDTEKVYVTVDGFYISENETISFSDYDLLVGDSLISFKVKMKFDDRTRVEKEKSSVKEIKEVQWIKLSIDSEKPVRLVRSIKPGEPKDAEE